MKKVQEKLQRNDSPHSDDAAAKEELERLFRTLLEEQKKFAKLKADYDRNGADDPAEYFDQELSKNPFFVPRLSQILNSPAGAAPSAKGRFRSSGRNTYRRFR